MVTGEQKLNQSERAALEAARERIAEANKREREASMRGLAAVLSAPRVATNH
jgi:hypothetical protein